MNKYYKRKTIPCKQCGKRFKEAWQIAQHAKFEHPKVKPESAFVPDPGKYLTQVDQLGSDVQVKRTFVSNYCPNCGHKLI